MDKYIVVSILMLTSFASNAGEKSAVRSDDGRFQECVAVSLYTMQGRELNSAVKNNRKIEETNLIPEGWSVVGVTEETEADTTKPYLVICH